jgi:hypothetical protein
MKAGAESFVTTAVKLSVTILIGGVVYFAAASLLRCPELSSIGVLFRPVMQKLKAGES